MIKLSPLKLINPRVTRLNSRWTGEYECHCGTRFVARNDDVQQGKQGSCGCIKRARQKSGNPRHGLRHTPEYNVWVLMKKRCFNPNDKFYYCYGGRGITVCKEWKEDFSAFYRDMGPRPSPKHSIDRINNDGNYEPGNCRWATAVQQRHNRRDSK